MSEDEMVVLTNDHIADLLFKTRSYYLENI